MAIVCPGVEGKVASIVGQTMSAPRGRDMASSARDRFAELIGSARAALRDVGRPASATRDSDSVLKAATAASRAAGFIEAVTINDPLAAREMVAEFETLVDLAEKKPPPARS